MNWEILAAVALVCLIAGVLISNLVKGGAAKAKSGASSLLDDAKSAGTTAVHKVESGAHSIGDLLHHPAPAPAAAPAASAAPAPVTSSDPIAAAHAALDAAIAEAQKALDDAKAKKDTLTKTVTAAVAAAK